MKGEKSLWVNDYFSFFVLGFASLFFPAIIINENDEEEYDGCLYDWLYDAGSYWLDGAGKDDGIKPTIELDMNSIFVNSSEYGIPSGWTVKMTSENGLPGYGYAGGY